MLNSIWKMPIKNYKPLTKNINAEVLVIGGGIAGFLTAFELSSRGYGVTLLEADNILKGVTQNTTAFITALQGNIYFDLVKKYSLNFAKKYFTLHQEAISEYEKLVKKYDIDCNFTKLPAYLFTRKSVKPLIKEYNAIKSFGQKVFYTTTLNKVNLKINGAIKINNQATFHPLKFLTGLPISFDIYENSRVVKIDFDKNTVYTKNASVKAKYIVFATHFPIFTFPNLFPFKMYQAKSYCLAYQNTYKLEGLYIEDVEDGITLRNYQNHIIIGGKDHPTKVIKTVSPYKALKTEYSKIFDGSKPKYAWQTQDCITMDGLPYISRLNKNRSNCFVLTGFNKWGMAKAIMGAKLIADLIENKQNKYEKLCSIKRHALLKSVGNTLKHTLTGVFNLTKSFLSVPLKDYQNLKTGEGGVFLVKGVKRAVYKDEKGEFYFFDARCPHLKCQLKFDKVNKTFICPCHGSSFSVKGNILIEPTVKPITLDNKKN